MYHFLKIPPRDRLQYLLFYSSNKLNNILCRCYNLISKLEPRKERQFLINRCNEINELIKVFYDFFFTFTK